MSTLIPINIKTVRGQDFTFKVNPGDKVSFLKYLIEAESNPEITFETQTLLQNGKIIEDDKLIGSLSTEKPLILFYRRYVD